jgi:hypothetical protein
VRLDLLQSVVDMADHLIMDTLQIKAAAMLAAAVAETVGILMVMLETAQPELLVKATQVAVVAANIIQVAAAVQENQEPVQLIPRTVATECLVTY